MPYRHASIHSSQDLICTSLWCPVLYSTTFHELQKWLQVYKYMAKIPNCLGPQSSTSESIHSPLILRNTWAPLLGSAYLNWKHIRSLIDDEILRNGRHIPWLRYIPSQTSSPRILFVPVHSKAFLWLRSFPIRSNSFNYILVGSMAISALPLWIATSFSYFFSSAEPGSYSGGGL